MREFNISKLKCKYGVTVASYQCHVFIPDYHNNKISRNFFRLFVLNLMVGRVGEREKRGRVTGATQSYKLTVFMANIPYTICLCANYSFFPQVDLRPLQTCNRSKNKCHRHVQRFTESRRKSFLHYKISLFPNYTEEETKTVYIQSISTKWKIQCIVLTIFLVCRNNFPPHTLNESVSVHNFPIFQFNRLIAISTQPHTRTRT